MATIDLGRIKFKWQGAWSSSTSYVVDDVVESGGNTYVCIAASTNNVPPNATYWELMAQKGTDTSVATTQGDIIYHNGTSLARLGAGTSGQALLTQGTGANPIWGDGGTIKSLNYTIYGTQQVVSGSNGNNAKFSNLAVTVTPQSTSSKFLLSATINGETNDSPWDYVFNFVRTVGGSDTDLGSTNHVTGGNATGYKGIACIPTSFAASSSNNDSTPEGATFNFIDSPNTTSAITYVPTFIGNGSNFSLNRCVAVGNEAFVSTMYVMEF